MRTFTTLFIALLLALTSCGVSHDSTVVAACTEEHANNSQPTENATATAAALIAQGVEAVSEHEILTEKSEENLEVLRGALATTSDQPGSVVVHRFRELSDATSLLQLADNNVEALQADLDTTEDNLLTAGDQFRLTMDELVAPEALLCSSEGSYFLNGLGESIKAHTEAVQTQLEHSREALENI